MGETKKKGEAAQNPLPVPSGELLRYFEKQDIDYTLYEHAPVFTVAESEHLKRDIPGLHCRNLFLRDKKKRNYLVVVGNDTGIDLKKLPALLGCDRLSFGSAERLWQYLGVRPGSVCPFSIINDTAGEVEIVLEKDMLNAELVNYHPMENHLTVGLTPAALLKFIESCNHKPRIVDLKDAAPDKES